MYVFYSDSARIFCLTCTKTLEGVIVLAHVVYTYGSLVCFSLIFNSVEIGRVT